MRRHGWIGLALVLAGCGSDEKTQTVTGPSGETATITTSDAGERSTIRVTGADGEGSAVIEGAGAAWPADAPAYGVAYPGAVVEAAFTGAGVGDSGAVVSFATADTPAQVVDFYAARAKAAGLSQVMNMDTNGARMFNATDEAGRGVTVQAGPDGGRTKASVMFGTGKG